jgi:hypothetical protein
MKLASLLVAIAAGAGCATLPQTASPVVVGTVASTGTANSPLPVGTQWTLIYDRARYTRDAAIAELQTCKEWAQANRNDVAVLKANGVEPGNARIGGDAGAGALTVLSWASLLAPSPYMGPHGSDLGSTEKDRIVALALRCLGDKGLRLEVRPI